VFAELSQFLAERQVGHAFGGQPAIAHWTGATSRAEPELFLWSPFGEEAVLLDTLANAPFPPLPTQTLALTQRYRQIFLPLPGLAPLRVILCALPFERAMLDRRLALHPPLISAEDLLLLMLFRLPPTVLSDAAAILQAQRGRLQWPYVDHWLPQLAELKDDPRPLQALAHLRATLSQSLPI
jgi:hypothetical protein